MPLFGKWMWPFGILFIFQGLPDFLPPSFLIDALNESAKDNTYHQYTRPMVSLAHHGASYKDVSLLP